MKSVHTCQHFGWTHRKWPADDQYLEQMYRRDMTPNDNMVGMAIERTWHGPWYIVRRDGSCNNAIVAPRVAGPFESFRIAAIAYKLIGRPSG